MKQSNKSQILPFLLLLASSSIVALPGQVKIGILLHEHQYEQEILFKWSIEQVNQMGIINNTKLQGLIKRVEKKDCWDAERKACELLEGGAIAIIGPTDHQSSTHVGSICDALDVPHINVAPRGVVFASQPSAINVEFNSPQMAKMSPPEFQSSISIDMTIPRASLTQAYLDVLQALGWKQFVYAYERDDSLFHIQQHYAGKAMKAYESEMKVVRFDPRRPYRDAFWALKKTNNRQIMLDVRCSNLRTVLKHAQQVSMMTEAHSYIIVCLDTQTFDLEDFKYSRSRIVWLSLCDKTSESMINLSGAGGVSGRVMGSMGFRFVPDRIKTESALIHDAIETFAQALGGADSDPNYLNMRGSVSCSNSRPWSHGSTIVNSIRTSVELDGMTGKIRFDPTGQRSDFMLHINYLTSQGPRIVGNWSNQQLLFEKQELHQLKKGDPTLYEGEDRDLLVITSIKNEPYLMMKMTTKVESGNSRYEGYAVDLIDELSKIVGFDYVFKEVDDGKYGKYEAKTGQWNGMIREVMIGRADLAIGDLSITSSREDAVDFTLPFMSTGISILFKKPTTKELELFSFLAPFDSKVWLYVFGAYMGVSFLLFVVGRISPYEWADPHPCRQEDKVLRNQFSLSNAYWFTIAAVMQQGSDLAPRSLSTRLIASFWYFFTLIMISSYTANLAAFLTVEKVIYPIEKAEDLYQNPHKIEYGCVESGSTGAFFQSSKPGSIYSKMFPEMKMVSSNDIGKARVEEGNYAYFMESTSIEYTIERFCNLTQIGGLLDSKGYGIAIAKNSTKRRDYRTKLSEAILSLQESGMLEILKNRWWKEKRGGGACDIDDGQGGEGVKELTLANVGGVFVVLAMGITASFILCAVEVYARSCKLAQTRGTTRWEQMKRRIKFAFALSENY